MKHFLTFLTVFISVAGTFAQVGIGTTNPNAAAALDITSTNKGFLPPRLTFGQRENIDNATSGLIIWCTNCGPYGELQVYNGTAWTNVTGGEAQIGEFDQTNCPTYNTEVIEVTSPYTSRIWMDRNLGASRAATSANDADSFGDLYQWGRGNDGHQCRSQSTTFTLSDTDNPVNGKFILSNNGDWRTEPNNNLWQGNDGGINNPCPTGYRLPTSTEWTAELTGWNNDATGASNSFLKLPVASARSGSDGSTSFTIGLYWSSTVNNDTSAKTLIFVPNNSTLSTAAKSNGLPVRCIKSL
jgi:uncharacterized protein (TIGR02145 family)